MGESMMEKIRNNIEKWNQHIYLIYESMTPRYAYSIGLFPSTGFELIVTGCAFYDSRFLHRLLNYSCDFLRSNARCRELEWEGHFFRLQEVHSSWSEQLILGAIDFYNSSEIPAMHLVPVRDRTVDIAEMTVEFDVEQAGCWKWLAKPWSYEIPVGSKVVADINALKGAPIVEAMRWKEDYWEMFSDLNQNIVPENTRKVPIGVLLAHDESLTQTLDCEIKKGMWRQDKDSSWQHWQDESE